MATGFRRMFWGTAAVLMWLLIPTLITLIGVGSFVVPAKVAGWKAQGITEAPLGWQLVVDASDMAKNRWIVVFPVVLLAAAGATAMFGRTPVRAAETNVHPTEGA